MNFFKLYAVGNGGMRCYECVRYLHFENEEEMDSWDVEQIIGPLSGGIRSVHWHLIEPTKELIDNEISNLQGRRKYIDAAIKELEAKMPSE